MFLFFLKVEVMKKMLVFIFLFSSSISFSSMNNRYGGKDARRINLIAQKANHQATKSCANGVKRIELQKARLAEITIKKIAHEQQKFSALITTPPAPLTLVNYPNASWKKSNFSYVE